MRSEVCAIRRERGNGPGAYAVETSSIHLGRGVVLRPGTMLFASPLAPGIDQIVIRDHVLIGSGVHIYVSNHDFGHAGKAVSEQGHGPVQPVLLHEGCWIGAAAVILPGVTVGANAVVGAGSVVTRDVAANTIVAGNPAKMIRTERGPKSD